MTQSLDDCRQRVHAWGKVNRVIFDAAKKHSVVIHPRDSHGEPFKLFGLMIDLDLRMHSAINQLWVKNSAEKHSHTENQSLLQQ